MPRYIRAFVPGGTFFFTLALLERRRRWLTEHIGSLRAAFTAGRSRKPFTMNAIVVLLDHLHCLWTLPAGDADFSSRCQHDRRDALRFPALQACAALQGRMGARKCYIAGSAASGRPTDY